MDCNRVFCEIVVRYYVDQFAVEARAYSLAWSFAMLAFAALTILQTPARTTIAGLNLLPAGRLVKNPSELLGSSRMSDLVSALKALD